MLERQYRPTPRALDYGKLQTTESRVVAPGRTFTSAGWPGPQLVDTE